MRYWRSFDCSVFWPASSNWPVSFHYLSRKRLFLLKPEFFQGAADLTAALGFCAESVQSINSTGVKFPPIISTGWLSSHVSTLVDPSFSM